MKIRHPLIIKSLGLLGAWLVRGWMRTLKKHHDYSRSGFHPTNPKQQRFIYAFWHEAILYASTFRTKVHVLISHHSDGEFITQICRHLGIGTVRGSTRRGGTSALLELMELSQKSHLAITPDGPRGPRRRVQPGVIFLAAKTGLPIIPFGVGYEKDWRANSWDRFVVPCPFTTAYAVGAEPISVPADLDLDGIEHYRQLLEERLLQATEIAEHRAKRTPYLLQMPAKLPERRLAVSA
jgi:lysophospholipid acyltransferase (LPLAT)-like uncharacterized protein